MTAQPLCFSIGEGVAVAYKTNIDQANTHCMYNMPCVLAKIRFPSMDEVRKYAKPHSRLCNTSGGSSTAHAWIAILIINKIARVAGGHLMKGSAPVALVPDKIQGWPACTS